MKKYLVVLAAALVALASCTTPEGNKYTSIKFKDAAIELSIGETKKLNVLYEPTTLEAPTCEWASSNEEVATVENGVVTAIDAGEATITAKCGELTAVCQVTVKDEMDLINWAGWSIWNFDEDEVLTDTFDVELSDGWYKCVMVPATAFVWDDNITPTKSNGRFSGLSGAGYVMEIVNMPIYIIAAGDYAGYYVGSQSLYIVDPDKFNINDTAYAYCAPAGKLGDAQKFYSYLTDTTAVVDYSECITGCELSAIDWDAQKGYYWFGLIGQGVVAGNYESIYYKQYVNWFEYRYGLAVVETEEGLDFKQPAEWGKLIEKYYENLPEQEVKKGLFKVAPTQQLEKPAITYKRATAEEMKAFMHK